MDIPNLQDTEIVEILSGTVDSSLVANLKTHDRSGIKRSNTNNKNTTETSTSFNKLGIKKMEKLNSKKTQQNNRILVYGA